MLHASTPPRPNLTAELAWVVDMKNETYLIAEDRP